MNTWLIGYGILIVALVAAVVFKSRLGSRYLPSLACLTALLIATCFVQWSTEGATTWTLAIGAVAIVLSIVGAFKAYLDARTPGLS